MSEASRHDFTSFAPIPLGMNGNVCRKSPANSIETLPIKASVSSCLESALEGHYALNPNYYLTLFQKLWKEIPLC